MTCENKHRRHSTVKYRGLPSLSTRTGVSVSFLLVLNWNLTDFIREKINSQQWEDPKVSVQLVHKYRSLGKAIQNRTKRFCTVLFAIIVSQTEDGGRGGGGVTCAFKVRCLNRLLNEGIIYCWPLVLCFCLKEQITYKRDEWTVLRGNDL